MEKYFGETIDDDNKARRMRFARWITKAANTYSEYVLFIAFPLQKQLRESTSMLRYTCTASLVEDYVDEFKTSK